MAEAYTCPWHNTEQTEECAACVERLANLPLAKTMTVVERADEMQDWIDKEILTVPFSDMQMRIEALVGRPLWTHELANADALVQEIRSGQSASFEDVVNKVPAEKRIIALTE
jgi:lysophospholipid acyltransferase (LPLAT)-like uncharacterized protein